MTRLEAIEARLKAATPGKWEWWSTQDDITGPYVPGSGWERKSNWGQPVLSVGNPDKDGDVPVVDAGGGEYCPYRNPADAILIAAAPEDIALLLAAVKAAIAEREKYGNRSQVLREALAPLTAPTGEREAEPKGEGK